MLNHNGTFAEKLGVFINPTIDWGPALVQHRSLVDYVDGWVVDPNNPISEYPTMDMQPPRYETKVDFHNEGYSSENL
ncbi:hypothetical protein EB796_014137 [Bugula neritina]|uniref:Uncharacterized protein n=1 Tax=Bugula neritina TaxID=10212 RepID=A0A7J7JQ49_BUGNE|nr:hypothetical protein EB796_014137 [Bugula neritina]